MIIVNNKLYGVCNSSMQDRNAQNIRALKLKLKLKEKMIMKKEKNNYELRGACIELYLQFPW